MTVCENASLIVRPTPQFPAGKQQIHEAMCLIAVVYFLASCLVFFALKSRYERLRMRTGRVIVVCTLGAFFYLLGGPFVFVVGWGHYPCWLSLVTPLLVVPLIGLSFVVRLSQLFYLDRFANAAVRARNRQGSSSELSSTIYDVDADQRRHSSLELLGSGLRLLATGREDADTVRGMRSALWMLSRQGTVTLLGVLLAPSFAVIAVLLAVEPAYAHGCTGCLISTPVVVTAAMEGFLIVLLATGIMMLALVLPPRSEARTKTTPAQSTSPRERRPVGLSRGTAAADCHGHGRQRMLHRGRGHRPFLSRAAL